MALKQVQADGECCPKQKESLKFVKQKNTSRLRWREQSKRQTGERVSREGSCTCWDERPLEAWLNTGEGLAFFFIPRLNALLLAVPALTRPHWWEEGVTLYAYVLGSSQACIFFLSKFGGDSNHFNWLLASFLSLFLLSGKINRER